MNRLALLISTCLGIGYTPKGGGTLASAICCLIWYFTGYGGNARPYERLLATFLLLVAGIWSAGKMEERWGKDSYRIVIDEVAGMCITLLFVPLKWQYAIAGLILFRFFDIAKPLYIRRMENLKGGWGVMMDDALAGLYSNLILQALMQQKLL
ncbi:MAG TPA: phosphatidylglycerophosphatase A [Puia sp.]|nr:phosphatidylglycerophosphatase A [Puia sp.]